MNEVIKRLEYLLKSGQDLISSDSGLSHKPTPTKWSRKEILGHLVDSGINNLQRFTEIQFEPKPYQIRKYNQDELVIANKYQAAEIDEISSIWLALNLRILAVMKAQTKETLAYPIELPDGKMANLEFLMKDYVDHMEHHLEQIARRK